MCETTKSNLRSPSFLDFAIFEFDRNILSAIVCHNLLLSIAKALDFDFTLLSQEISQLVKDALKNSECSAECSKERMYLRQMWIR